MGNKIYEVKKGDTLWDIAEKELGDANRWKEITKGDGSTYSEKEAKNLQAGAKIYIPNITHRELLTFSNLTNLEWQFVNLETKNEDEEKRSTKLNDLLSNPKLFVSGYKDPEKKQDPIYEYGKADESGNYKTEIGLAEMRQEAGIAMEYLEKEKQGNSEGSFLKEWEVVYGADNYKIVKDYIDNLFEVLAPYFEEPKKSKEEKEEFCLSREEIAEAKQKRSSMR